MLKVHYTQACVSTADTPITPSTEIAEKSAELLPKLGGKFIQMEDEIAGIAAAIGGSIAGFKSMDCKLQALAFHLSKKILVTQQSLKFH